MRKLLVLILLIAGVCPWAFSADPCSALAAAKSATYGFRPSQLPPAQRAEKIKAVNAFYDQVKAAGPAGPACLRNMIAQEKTDHFFAFDAAMLLSLLDTTGASDSAIEAGLLQADFADANVVRYLAASLTLSRRGRDIGKIAGHYLHAPSVETTFPNSQEKLDRPTGAILLYGSMSPELVDTYLAPEVSAPEPNVRDAAAAAWVTNMTERSFAGIAALGSLSTLNVKGRPYIQGVMTWHPVTVTPAQYTREQILARLQKFPDVGKVTPEEAKVLDNSTVATLTVADLPALRDARRRMVMSVSPASFRGYFAVTKLLLNTINHLDAYKQYRKH